MTRQPPHSAAGGWSGQGGAHHAHAMLPSMQNWHVERTESLVSPSELKAEIPLSDVAHQTIFESRQAIHQILAGTDQRLMIVVGPCSIHDETAALDYAQRLADLRRKVIDRLYLVMRVYFEKPRTTTGWKGLINDPHLNDSFDIGHGVRAARRILSRIADLGLPTGTEMLEPFTPAYISDLVSWTAIGARTTESQTHRQMASGLSMPVGFKNSTDGNLQNAIDAMRAAHQPHAFLGIDDDGRLSMIRTRGNPNGHIILRGGRDRSNFAPEDVQYAAEQLRKFGLPGSLMVDCSHANSGKKAERQHVAFKSVVHQRVAGNADLSGLMLESFIHEGAQKLTEDPTELKYGISITDACIGWDETEHLIQMAYDTLE